MTSKLSKISRSKIVISLWFFLFIFVPFSGRAHEYETNLELTLILHVEPSHSPIIGKPAKIQLTFQNKKGEFAINDCTCTATISHNGQQIYTIDLKDHEDQGYLPETYSFPYTFPEKGTYSLSVKGASIKEKFPPFEFKFDIEATRTSDTFGLGLEHLWHSGHIGHLLFAIFVAIFMLFYVIKEKINKNKIRTEGGL